jgi:glycerate-2-kinase
MKDLKEAAKRVFLSTLNAIEPDTVIRQSLRVDRGILRVRGEEIHLGDFTEILLIGIGKASLKMGASVENLLGDRIKRGILVTDRRTNLSVRSEVVVAGHPLPDANSLIAGEKIVKLVESAGDAALVLFLISGGGSSLVEMPVSTSITLEDLRSTNQVLIGCGASIRQINNIRKSLSRIKGGQLGYLAKTSRCVGLYLSDVNPGDLHSIASNPLLPEEVEEEAVHDVVNRFKLAKRIPLSVVRAIERLPLNNVASGKDWGVTQPLAVVLLDNSHAIHAAAHLAKQLGFRVEVDADLIDGEYRPVADRSIEHLLRLRSSYPDECVCVISGGEVSCPVRGNGIGGRNQEFVLYSAARLAGLGVNEQIAVLSCGTDGIDGNSDAAGAVADAGLVIRAKRQGSDASIFLSDNDSHTFFKKTGGLVVTGPTGNNVRDLRILMTQ